MAKKTIIFSVITGILIFISVLFFSNIKDISNVIFSLPFYQFLIFLFIFFIQVLILVYRWQFILKSQGYNLPFKELFSAKAGCYAISYSTPFSRLGGEPVRAYILSKKSKVPLLKAFETVVEDKIIEITNTLLFVLCGVTILFMNYTLAKNVEITLISIVGIFLLILGFFYMQIMKGRGFFSMFIKMFHIDKIKSFPEIYTNSKKLEVNIANFFRNRKKIVIQSFIISAIANMTILFNSMILMHFLGYKLSLISALIIFSLTSFATTVPIPGALGVYESFSALAFGLLGFTAATGVAFSLFVRMTELSLVAIGIIFLYQYSFKLLMSFVNPKD